MFTRIIEKIHKIPYRRSTRKELLESAALAATFFQFGFAIIASKNQDLVANILFFEIMFWVLVVLSFTLFAIFFIACISPAWVPFVAAFYGPRPKHIIKAIAWYIFNSLVWPAFVIVFIGGLVYTNNQLPASLQPWVLYGGVLFVLLISIILVVYSSVRKRKSSIQANDNKVAGWLSDEVKRKIKSIQKTEGGNCIQVFWGKLALPGWTPILTGTCLLGISVLISWIIARESGYNYVEGQLHTTLLQVQAGIAAVTPPILLFVTQLAKDQSVAIRTHEVLIRDTRIFFIVILAFVGIIHIGINLLWYSVQTNLIIDIFAVLALTLGLVIYAYAQTLRILLNRQLLKKRSIAIAKEMMDESLQESIFIRVANNTLFEKINQLGILYWPTSIEPFEEDQYHILRIKDDGMITDLHLGRFESLMNYLANYKIEEASLQQQGQVDYRSTSSQVPSKARSIGLMKTYGDEISEGNNSIIRLGKWAFGELDDDELEDLQERINNMIRVEKLC